MVRFSRTNIADCLANQSIVRVAGDTCVSETGRSYDIEFRTCSKLLLMISDERRDSQSEGSSLAFDLGSSDDLTKKNHGGHYGSFIFDAVAAFNRTVSRPRCIVEYM